MCRISDDIIIRVRTICTGLSPGNRTMSNTTAMKQGLLLLRMHLGSAPVVSCCWVFFVFVLFFVCMSVWLVAHLLLFSVFCVLFVFLLFLLPNVTSVSGLFILVSSAQCYQCFGTDHSCFFCPMLPVFRDCSFLLLLSNVTSVSGLFILDCSLRFSPNLYDAWNYNQRAKIWR